MSEDNQSRGEERFAADDIEEEKLPPPHIPKNPMIRPAEVEISKIMQDLMKNDSAQEHLHRILGSAADIDNEKTVADHMQKVFEVLVESYPHCAL